MFVLQQLINGFLLGGVYAVATAGFALVWGVMNEINIAHAAFMAIASGSRPLPASSGACAPPSPAGSRSSSESSRDGCPTRRRRFIRHALRTVR